jgi:hypothetical protein
MRLVVLSGVGYNLLVFSADAASLTDGQTVARDEPPSNGAKAKN